MAFPLVAAGIEQRSQPPCHLVSTRDVRALAGIALKTTQCEIACNCWSVVFFGEDMVDLERGIVEILGHSAVFTPLPGAIPDCSRQYRVHASLNSQFAFAT